MRRIFASTQSAIREIWRWIVSLLRQATIAALLVAFGYLWGANTVLEGKPNGMDQIKGLVTSIGIPPASASNTSLQATAENAVSTAAHPLREPSTQTNQRKK